MLAGWQACKSTCWKGALIYDWRGVWSAAITTIKAVPFHVKHQGGGGVGGWVKRENTSLQQGGTAKQQSLLEFSVLVCLIRCNVICLGLFLNNSLYNVRGLGVQTPATPLIKSRRAGKSGFNEKRKRLHEGQIWICTFILESGAVLICKQKQHGTNEILIDTHK